VEALAEMRRVLKDELEKQPPFPEVVGDRRLLRFLRVKKHNVKEATALYAKFLKFRIEKNVDVIRQDIVYGGKNSPLDFPFGANILDIAPSIVMSAKAPNSRNQPLWLDTYKFKTCELKQRVNIEEYITFLIYSMEYRALVLEQMSERQEEAIVQKLLNGGTLSPKGDKCMVGTPVDSGFYGCIECFYCIRDLAGVGFGHLGVHGMQVFKASLDVGTQNYPGFLSKCYVTSVPFIFNAFWLMIKGLLDEQCLAKISLSASGKTHEVLLADGVPMSSIPELIGGEFKLYNEAFEFDSKGALHYPGAPNLNEYQASVLSGLKLDQTRIMEEESKDCISPI
jgi:hypothetical protein